MLWLLPLLPVTVAPVLWLTHRGRSRARIGASGATVLVLTTAIAAWAAATRPASAYAWGAGLTLRLAVDDTAAVVGVLVPVVAIVVVVYAAGHENAEGLARLVAGLVAFTGAMELLVVAADVLTLVAAWELVGGCSWALIAHEWRTPGSGRAAGQAFVATHVGDLGLVAAAGAALAATGSLRYADLGGLRGGWLDLFVAGVVLAAVSKSAQLPFSPWLFSAMAGPTSVSALLHAATMVAAGAFILVRLQPVLDTATWFAPTVIGVGLATALVGGAVAVAQRHTKKLLAASTSAQYGLMFVAVGAGVPAAALAHLVAHAAFKAGLFLSAGVAMEAAGGPELARMRLGRDLRGVAVATAVLAAALAAIPPLGAAWTKEAIAAAAGHGAAWLAIAVALAGALSAAYATRFQLLAFGPPPTDEPRTLVRRPGVAETGTIVATAAVSLAFAIVWVPGARDVVARFAGGVIAEGEPWEIALSLALVAAGVCTTVAASRRTAALVGDVLDDRQRTVADWFALPAAVRSVVVEPTLAAAGALARMDTVVLDAPARAATRAGPRLASALAAIDHRVVDAGVRAAAAFGRAAARVGATVTERAATGAALGLADAVGRAGRDTRRLQTGRAHQFYVSIVAAAVVLVAVTAAWR